MKWFKHESDDRNKLESKLIRTKFGSEGYGIYMCLREVISEYVDKEVDIEDWGSVHPLHNITTLAEECSTTAEKLKEFLIFCDEKQILMEKNDRLHDPLIIKRLDTFMDKVLREKKTTKGRNKTQKTSKSVRSQFEVSSHIEEKRIEENRREEKRPKGDEQPFASPDYLLNVPVEDLERFHETYEVSIDQIKTKAERLKLWLVKKGRSYKNYRAALQDCLLKDYGKRKTPIKPKADYVYNPETRSYKQILKA